MERFSWGLTPWSTCISVQGKAHPSVGSDLQCCFGCITNRNTDKEATLITGSYDQEIRVEVLVQCIETCVPHTESHELCYWVRVVLSGQVPLPESLCLLNTGETPPAPTASTALGILVAFRRHFPSITLLSFCCSSRQLGVSSAVPY